MAKIYISSTYSDLKEYRAAVYRALNRMKHDVFAMEDYVATGRRPLDECLTDVAGCDLGRTGSGRSSRWLRRMNARLHTRFFRIAGSSDHCSASRIAWA